MPATFVNAVYDGRNTWKIIQNFVTHRVHLPSAKVGDNYEKAFTRHLLTLHLQSIEDTNIYTTKGLLVCKLCGRPIENDDLGCEFCFPF